MRQISLMVRPRYLGHANYGMSTGRPAFILFPHHLKMNLSKFILSHTEKILVEWEEFATTFGAATDNMSSQELRDHAKQILEFVAKDIQQEQTPTQADAKSHGREAFPTGDDSASVIHGRLRYASGFTLLQLIAEYRALRASVLKLWKADGAAALTENSDEIMRFNEAIDQSLADAAVAYSDKLNETRDMFVAILGHDLRSPLAAMATAGSYLTRAGAFEDPVQQIGVRVKRSAATMNGMVNDLLALARTQLGEGIPIDRQDCDLLEICQWAIEDANAAHPHARFHLHATGELMGSFDQSRLQQLLTNLAINAAQYGTPNAPVNVNIVGETRRILLEVQNQGPVIPEAALSNLFTSLVQLPEISASSRPRSSLGLGLYIAKQIAVAHGGDIFVQSEELNGTTFTVEIGRE
jgi:signal transduction histidine kinase